MTYDFLLKTGQMKPFNSVEEFEKFEDDLCSLPDLNIKQNAAMGKSNIKKGFTERGESVDSFAEYTFCTYKRLVENATVVRNERDFSLDYYDENHKKCKYYPDFVVNGIYCEVKGRYTLKDQCKKEQHPEVEWYFQEQINVMAHQLDESHPGWRDKFVEKN